MDYWGGKYKSMCKACGELRGSWGVLRWEILSLDLLLDAIWWNFELFSHKHNLSSENNFADVSTECSSRHQGETSAKLFSKLKLVTDNLLSIYAAAN